MGRQLSGSSAGVGESLIVVVCEGAEEPRQLSPLVQGSSKDNQLNITVFVFTVNTPKTEE